MKFTDQQKYAKLERLGVMSICPDCHGSGKLESGEACQTCMAHSTTSVGTGYVDRSIFSQLGDFFYNLFEMRVYNAKGKEIKTIDPVNLWKYLGDTKVFEGKLMSAAHLIQGSSEGRFTITYATNPELMSEEEINGVGYEWMDYKEAVKRYDPEKLKEGWNTLPDGEEIYYVPKPALGLWKIKE